MKYILITIALFFSVLTISGQSAQDAITVGQQFHGGTARYMSMGGAFNALGGDFSTLSVNPAGIGIYRSNEFTFTGDLRFSNVTTSVDPATTLFGNEPLSPHTTENTQTKSNFNLGSVGYISGTDMGTNGLVRLNFGFGYNRLKNYHKAYRGDVLNSPHSLTDNWSYSLNENGLDESRPGSYLGYQSFVMNEEVINGNSYYTSPLLEGATVDYIKDVVEEGRINEWIFSVGGNVNHVVYFGATIGIQDIKMDKQYTQTEVFQNIDDPTSSNHGYSYVRPEDPEPFVAEGNKDYFDYMSEEYTDGTGLNAKFGVIIRPLDIIRFGVAVHTPTINFMTVNHYAKMYNNTYFYDGGDLYSGETVDKNYTSYEYRTITPYKLHGSVAIILGKTLALDAEVDMVDYSTMKVTDTNGGAYAYKEANDAIDEMYKVSYNARVGAELKLAQVFSLRAGMSYYGTPYDENIVYKTNGDLLDAADYYGDRFDYSGGFGFRTGDFFLDFAYIHTVQENTSMIFDSAISAAETSEMRLDEKTNRFMMTMGFKF